MPSWSSTSAIQKSKPSWTVIVERVAGDQVLQPRALAGRVGEADDAGLVGLQRLEQHRAEVAGRVAEVVLHLQAEPDLAAVAHHRRRRHRQQRAELHGCGRSSFSVSGAVAAGTSSRSATTSHSDGMPSKGRPTKTAGAPPARTVAGLVALARAAGAGLARADLAPAAGGGSRAWCGTSWPCGEPIRRAPGTSATSSRSSRYAGRSVMTAFTPRSRHSCELGLGVHRPHVHVVAGRGRSGGRSSGCSASSSMPGPTIQSSPDHPAQHRPVVRALDAACTSGTSGASRSTRCSAVHEKLITRAGEPAPVPAEVAQQVDQPALDQRRRTGSGAWSRSRPRPGGRSRRRSRAACAGSAPGRGRSSRSGASSSRSAHGFFQDAKSSWSRSASSMVETTPRVLAVRRRSRSCTQTRWPSAVSRTSHSSASAPASSAATYARRVCSALSWLAPRCATTCGLMAPVSTVPGGAGRTTRPASPARSATPRGGAT